MFKSRGRPFILLGSECFFPQLMDCASPDVILDNMHIDHRHHYP